MDIKIFWSFIVLTILLKGTNALTTCPEGQTGYCESESSNRYYSCGGSTPMTDDPYTGFVANKYCQPLGTAPDSSSPCNSLYNYNTGGVCWPYSIGSTTASINLGNQKTGAQWTQQLNTVQSIYSKCKDGSSNPFSSEVSGSDLQPNGQGGWACCDTWYNSQININFCHSTSCWCPPPCSNPSKNTLLPYTSEPNWNAQPREKYCFTDCTSCYNLDYGARSDAICNSGGYTLPQSQGGFSYDFTGPDDCGCCRNYQPNPSGAATSPSSPSSASPSASPPRPPSQSSFPSGLASPSSSSSFGATQSPSKSDLPSPSPSSFYFNGSLGDSQSGDTIDRGKVAGIVIGVVAGICLLVVIIIIVIVIIAVVVFKVTRRSSTVTGVAPTSI